jgi:hypothetical protein
MAGYIAHASMWVKFFTNWQQSLLKYGISSIHMRELIPIEGEYKQLGWTIQTRDAVIEEFINIIKACQLVGFGVGLDATFWRQIPKDVTRVHGNAQEFCFTRIIRLVIERLSAIGEEEGLSLIYDRDMTFAKTRLNLFEAIRRRDQRAARQLIAITFADTRYFLGLQAADILAWETRKQLVQRAGGHQPTKRYQQLFEAMPDIELDYSGEFWDGSSLLEGMQNLFERESKRSPQPSSC